MSGRTIAWILAAAGVCGLLLIAAAGFVVYRLVGAFHVSARSMPPALSRPGVVQGAELLSKSVLLTEPSLGSVTGLIHDPTRDAALGVAGQRRRLHRGRRTVQSRVTFSRPGSQVEFLDVEGDGVSEFLNRGGVGWSDASLIDHTGRTLWTSGGMPGVDDMVAGDLDGDGIADFVVGFNGDGGLRRLDRAGHQVWQQSDGNVWHVELMDPDGDGKPEIVHSNAGGQITVRDQHGTVRRRIQPGLYVSSFSQCRWPTAKDRPSLLCVDSGHVWLIDPTAGRPPTSLNAPDCETLGHARGTLVRLKPGEREFLAVVVGYKNWHASVLYLFDQDEKLIYEEIIADSCSSVLAVPHAGSDAEDLLVGGTGVVWIYTAGK